MREGKNADECVFYSLVCQYYLFSLLVIAVYYHRTDLLLPLEHRTPLACCTAQRLPTSLTRKSPPFQLAPPGSRDELTLLNLQHFDSTKQSHRCTSLAIMAISDADFWPGLGGLSQNLNILYHAPAPM